MKIRQVIAVLALAAAGAVHGQGLDQLLQQVRASVEQEKRLNQEREAAFQRDRNQQASLLAQAQAELNQLEAQSAALRQEFEDNEKRLADFEGVVQERMGNLGELFGVVRQVAADSKGKLETSLVTAQFPDRIKFLNDLAGRRELPSMTELRGLWFEMQREITEQGKVVTFSADIRDARGDLQRGAAVTRIGVFTALASGNYTYWDATGGVGAGRIVTLKRQPQGRYTDLAGGFESAVPGTVAPMAVDLTRGAILSKVVDTATLSERVDQGGPVGYVILGLGAFGLLIALWRAVVLGLVGAKVGAQLRNPNDVRKDNALGRVMSVYTENPNLDVETLELKLDEQILRETGPLENGLALVKVIYVVAPLLGLLGTVQGMIQTFQQITLFGTGDPKTMAGGISTALVTTVQGLVVAIPLTIIHSWLQGRARRVIQILEEEAAGIIALVAEKR